MNLKPFLRRLHIVTKERGVVPYKLNWAQDDYVTQLEGQHNAGKPMRVIILKARQMGLSTATEAIIFALSFMYKHNRGLVVSHEQSSYEHLLGMTNTYWNTWPFQSLYNTKYSSRKELAWKETGSSIFTATAKSVDSARSQTVHALHASEVAFWPDPKTLMTGLRQVIPNSPGTFIALESTANGVGNYFHSTWRAAVAGESEFIPLFYPWWKHPEYTAQAARLPSQLGALEQEERLLKIYLSTQGMDTAEVDSRLIWRRYALRDLCQNDEKILHQEYPATPEEAFQSTGKNVFPVAKLNGVYRRNEGTRGFIHIENGTPKFTPNSDGTAAIYRWPSKNRDYGRYLISGDPTHTTRGDFAVIQVIHRRTFEQVARIRLRCTPIEFAQHLVAVARYYNDGLLVSESTGPGYATIGAIMTIGYPYVWQGHWLDKTPGSMSDRYGFETNFARKSAAIGWLLNCVVDGSILIHDPVTYYEMMNYVTLDGGGYGPNDKDGFDDCVMALAIGVICHMTEPPLPPIGTDTSRNLVDQAVETAGWSADENGLWTPNEQFAGYNQMVGTP